MPGGDDCRGRDHCEHEQSGEVLGAPIPVGVALVGGAAPEPESDEQGDGGEGVGKVVNGVGEQRDRAGGGDDDDLYDSGDHQGEERNLDGTDPPLIAFQRRVDGVDGVVAVGPEHVGNVVDDGGGCSC